MTFVSFVTFVVNEPMRIELHAFEGCAPVAVPVEPVLYELAAARWAVNWFSSFTHVHTPEKTTLIVFFVENPYADAEETRLWVRNNYLEICARVRASLLAPPVMN